MLLIKHKQNKIVNIDNVSNIFIDLQEGNKGKVIFNMNYSVKIFGDKITPDYVYWNFDNEQELEQIRYKFESKLAGWIWPFQHGQRYVNTACISSIGTDRYKNRVIFNLNYPVSHPKDIKKVTSDFVFFNFDSAEAYEEFLITL